MRTGDKPSGPRCSLAKLIAEPMDKEEVKRDGWNNHGILVVDASDPRLGWMERQVIETIGRRFYGGNRRT